MVNYGNSFLRKPKKPPNHIHAWRVRGLLRVMKIVILILIDTTNLIIINYKIDHKDMYVYSKQVVLCMYYTNM